MAQQGRTGMAFPAIETELVLVVNRCTSHPLPRRTLLAVRALLQEESGRVEVVETDAVEEFARLWSEAEGRRLVVVGGDGSVHAAANAPGPARELALIPCGSANNIARSLGIPLDPLAAAELAVRGRSHAIDLIEARPAGGSYRVVESLSAGFLAHARAGYHASNSGHLVAGAVAGAHALRSFHPLAVHVRRPEGEEDLTLAQLFVANLPLFEFGLQVAPHADARDGLLDFVGLEGNTRREVLAMIRHLRDGTVMGRRGVHLWRAERALIRPHGSTPVVGDSAILGDGTVEVRALRAALHLVRPG
jgi:diacylglycerol kinase family enzyme